MAQPQVQQREAENVVLLMEQTWVKIQQRTFTRWCNTFLVERMMKIDDFMDDFRDGVKLCNLLEVISAKKIKHNKKCRVKMQKLENVSFALQFLRKEGLTLVGIGPEDIVDPKLKLILGLIWTIILRYQIQRGEDQGGSAKSDLLKWVRSKIGPETPWNYDIKNFTSNWMDGKAICALAEACEPGQMNLPSDFTNDPLRDATMGMDSAEQNMGIPQILYPEDMVEQGDELSNMTYISYFRDWEEQHGQRKAAEALERTPVAHMCTASGPGVEGPCEVGIEAPFTITSINQFGRQVPIGGHTYLVEVKGPSKTVPVEVTDNKDGTYSGVYTPEEVGNTVVDIQLALDGFDPAHIKDSPFNVSVLAPEPDASQCLVYGQGVGEAPIYVGHEATFTIEAVNRLGNRITMGGAPFLLMVEGPYDDADPTDVKITDNDDGTYTGSYLPVLHGAHIVKVELKGAPVASSPYDVNVERDPDSMDPKQSWAEGQGLTDANTAEPNAIKVHAVKSDGQPMDHGGEIVDCEVLDPEGNVIPSRVVDNDDGTYDVEFDADQAGPHTVDLFVRQKADPTYLEHLEGYPKIVNVESGADPKQSLVYGPGVDENSGLRDNELATFTIEGRNKKGEPMEEGGDPFIVKVTGPEGDVPVDLVDNGDGTYSGSYQPEIFGKHEVDVSLKDDQVADSVYNVEILPGVDNSKTLVHGPGLEDGILATEEQEFYIEPKDKKGNPINDCTEQFDVSVKDPSGNEVPHTIEDDGDRKVVKYQPNADRPGDYVVNVERAAEPVGDTPKTVRIDPGADPKKTLVYGPGLEDGILDTQEQEFYIEPRDSRGNPIPGCTEPFDVTVEGPNGPIDCDVSEPDDTGKRTVKYQPDGEGNHHIEVKLKEDHVADSPYDVRVGAGAFAGTSFLKNFTFSLETRSKTDNVLKTGGESENISLEVSGPGNPTGKVEDNGNGEYTISLELDAQKGSSFEIGVLINGDHVKNSPFNQKF